MVLYDILEVLTQGDGTQVLYTDDKESPPFKKVIDETTKETMFKFSSHLYALTNKGDLMVSSTKTFTHRCIETDKDYTEDEVEHAHRVNIGIVIRSSLTEHGELKSSEVKEGIRNKILKHINKNFRADQVVRLNIQLLNNLPNKGSVSH